MIHLALLSEGKELPPFQHLRSTKALNKFLNAWGKIISAETLSRLGMSVTTQGGSGRQYVMGPG